MMMPRERKRVLLIGEQPDIELFATLAEEGYEVATLESAKRARQVVPLYKPHLLIVHLRYPKEVVLLEDCLAIAGRVPVVATISLLAKQSLVTAVKEKATAFVILPAKPQIVRETLRAVTLFENEAQLPSEEKRVLESSSRREKELHPAGSV